MRDKDAHLIFENYNNRVLLNEAAPLLLLLVPPALAFISGQLEFTSGTLDYIKKKTNGVVDIQALLDIPAIDFITNIADVTGLTYWPKLEKSMKEYEANPSPENFGEVVFNLFGTFPVLGRIKGLFSAIKTGKTALKEAPIIYKFLALMLQKSMDKIFKNPEFIKLIKKVFASSPKQVQERIIAIFSVLGTKWLIQELSSIGAESAAENAQNEKEIEKPKAQPSPTPIQGEFPTTGTWTPRKKIKPALKTQERPPKEKEEEKNKSMFDYENFIK